MTDLIIHPDEIFLKGTNRDFFYNALIKNLRLIFKNISVKRIESGLFATCFDEKKMDHLAIIPGISNFAPVYKGKNTIVGIKKSVDALIADYQKNIKFQLKFRISCKRSFKGFQYSSMQICEKMGAYVAKQYGFKVDLRNSDINIRISISNKDAFVFGDIRKGAGGLPVGVSGKILCLLSGGIDSPVATYNMMKRGAEIGLVHFENSTSVSEEVNKKIFDLAQTLSNIQPSIKLFIVPFAKLQREIIMKIPSKYRLIATRRIFMKISSMIAKSDGYKVLCTGDSLGQVASQTIENLTCTREASEIPVFSPLIGTNKREIIEQAKQINTLLISNRPYDDCCSLFIAKHPETRASLHKIKKMEEDFNLSTLDKIPYNSYYIGIK
ncbi:MAG: tRNA uracil 4-sulfurtransferase ThiI [bacterium]